MTYGEFYANVMNTLGMNCETDEIQVILNNIIRNMNTFVKGVYLTEKALTITRVTSDTTQYAITIIDGTTLSIEGDYASIFITGSEITGVTSGYLAVVTEDAQYDEDNDITTFKIGNTALFAGDTEIIASLYFTWETETGYSYSDFILTIPKSFTEVIEIELKDYSQGRRYPIRNYATWQFSSNEYAYPCISSRGSGGYLLGHYLATCQGEIYFNGRKQISPMTAFTDETVLPIPANWEDMLFTGVIANLYLKRGDKENYRHYVELYNASMVEIRNQEATNEPVRTGNRDWDYNLSQSDDEVERIDNGIHNWWSK